MGREAQSKPGIRGIRAFLVAGALGMMGLMGCAGTSGANRGKANQDLKLIRASERGETHEMFLLIRAGADINAIDSEGWTPYLAAATHGRLEAMKLLRALGAKTEAPEMETVARFNGVR